MCRLAYIKRPFDGMTKWLRSLERSMGGDGNGVAVGDRCIKGIGISVIETSQAIHDLQPRTKKGKRKHLLPALWHSRRISSGNKCDELCHPHPCADGWLVHNGHWQWAHEEAIKIDQFGPMSDSRLFSMMVDRDGFKLAATEHQPPGVWLHMTYDGKLAIWLGSGSLMYCPALGALGSEAAKVGGKWYDVMPGWTGYGETPKPAPVIERVKYNEHSYVYHDDHESDSSPSNFGKYFSWWR